MTTNYTRFVIVAFLLCCSATVSFAQEQEYISLAKKFFKLLDAKKYHECTLLFDSTLLRALNDSTLKMSWEPLLKNYGKLVIQDSELFESNKQYPSVFLGCVFEKATYDMKVVFNPEKKIIGFFLMPPRTKAHYKLPSYAQSGNLIQREVIVTTDTFNLPATLMLPKNVQHPPIVVFVHGSGPEDRDESIQANKPFLDIALGLAAHGIASLRYDKRTFVYGIRSMPDVNKMTPKEELVDDALSAIRLARTFNEVDTANIIILGHSLGGQFAPKIATTDNHLAGIIMMAAPARRFEDVVLDQMEFLLPQQMPHEKALVQIKLATEQVERIRKHRYSDTTSASQLLGLPATYWEYLLHEDQIKTTLSLSIPVLILQGDKDFQVGPKDFEIWKEALVKNNNVSFMLFPGLYHLFMPGQGTFTDYQTASNVSENVINVIAGWVNHH